MNDIPLTADELDRLFAAVHESQINALRQRNVELRAACASIPRTSGEQDHGLEPKVQD